MRRRRRVLLPLVAALCACHGRTLPEQTDAGDTSTTSTGSSTSSATAGTEAPTTSTGGTATTGEPVTCGNGVIEPGEVCLGVPVKVDAAWVHWVGTADLDGDGRTDLLTDAGAWLQRGAALEPAVVPQLVAGGKIGDFDGDGHGDLVAYDAAARTLALSRGDGAGGFAEPVVTAVTELGVIWPIDVDGDGRSELVARAPDLDALRTYAAEDDGTFVPLASQPLSFIAALLDAGDVDGDGLADLLVSETTTTWIWRG